MQAIIMAGGRGTRLQPLTERMPKPMLHLVDRPTMEYIVLLLRQHGVRDITVTVSYMAEKILNYFRNGSDWGVSIRYQHEDVPLGTAGGVRVLHQQLTDTFLVMSGDGLTDLNLTSAYQAHRKSRAMATLVLARVACPLGYGVVELTESGEVQSFTEKPTIWDSNRDYWVNTGIYILEPEVLELIPDNQTYDFGKDLFPHMMAMQLPVYGYRATDYWSDVGTLHQYYQSQLDIVNGRVQVPLPDTAVSLNG